MTMDKAEFAELTGEGKTSPVANGVFPIIGETTVEFVNFDGKPCDINGKLDSDNTQPEPVVEAVPPTADEILAQIAKLQALLPKTEEKTAEKIEEKSTPSATPPASTSTGK